MKRRAFFTSLGGLGLVAIAAPGCEVRDLAGPGPSTLAPPKDLAPLRTFAVPDGTEPALVFVPLRQKPRS